MELYSPSKLKSFESCPLGYKLHYLDQIKIERPVTSDTQFGSFIHEVAEVWDGTNKQEIIELLRGFTINKEYRSLIVPTLKNYFKFHEKYKNIPFEREQEFEYKSNEYWIHGILDRLMDNKEKYIVCDYKTAKTPNRDRFIFQMRFYNLMVAKKKNIAPSSIKCIIYYPRIHQEDKFMFSDKEIELFELDLKKRIVEVETTQNWKPKSGYHCRWCEFNQTPYCRK